MSRRAVGLTVAVVGLIVGLLFALADVIGLGGSPGFGTRQLIGALVGAVILIVGIVIYARSAAAASVIPPDKDIGGP
jgi:peptidoglycan/LPS O-acetylase OafA/YrhL